MTVPALSLVITRTGLQRFTAAQLGEDIDLTVSAVGLSDTAFVAAPTLTDVPGEFRRVATLSGRATGPDTVHLVVRDAAELRYEVRGFGLFLADGTLFAAYAQTEPIFEKSPRSMMHIAIDLVFPTGAATSLSFGDTNFLNPAATETVAGVVELATESEVATGTDRVRALTPATLAARLATLLAGINTAIATAVAERVPLVRRVNTSGLALGGQSLTTDVTISVPAATPEQLRNATAANTAVTPASFGGLGNVIAPTGSYTLPGGRVDKWGGNRVRSGESTVAVLFDDPFPTACFRVMLTPYTASGAARDNYWVQLQGAPSATGFNVKIQSEEANDGLDGFDWFAIGY